MAKDSYVVANWKMNNLREDATAFLSEFLPRYRPQPGVMTLIAPPFTSLEMVGKGIKGTEQLGLCSQNVKAMVGDVLG